MKKNLQFLFLMILQISSSFSWAQQKCESLFSPDSFTEVLQELAQLKVDAENTSDPMARKMIQQVYDSKYHAAEKSHLDLSPLPMLIEETRRIVAIVADKEHERKEVSKDIEATLAPLTFREVQVSGQVTSVGDGGKSLLVVRGNKIGVVDAKTQKLVQELTTPTEITKAVFSRRGQLIASSTDNVISLWDLQTGKKVKTLLGQKDSIREMEFSPDDTKLATWDGKSLLIWNLREIHEENFDATAVVHKIKNFFAKTSLVEKFESGLRPQLSPDWKKLITFEMDLNDSLAKNGKMTFHSEAALGKWKTNSPISVGYSNRALFSPDGTKVAVFVARFRSGDVVHVLDTTTEKELFNLEDATMRMDFLTRDVRRFSDHVDFSADSSKILTTGTFLPNKNYTGKEIAVIWDAHSGANLQVISDKINRDISVVKFGFDGSVLTRADNGVSELWTANGEKMRDLLPVKAYDQPVIWNSRASRQFITFEKDNKQNPGKILIWQPEEEAPSKLQE